MVTRVHYNGIKTIALRLETLRQQLERIVDDQNTDKYLEQGFAYALTVDHDDLEAMIGHLNETVHNVGKHLGIDGHVTHDS